MAEAAMVLGACMLLVAWLWDDRGGPTRGYTCLR